MGTAWRRLNDWIGRGPNQIALSTALRGMIATATPLVVLPLIGGAELAHLAVIGALGVSMVDVGGPYRRRLVAMVIAGVLGPSLLIAGLHVAGNVWLGAALMALLALGSGLVRALGPGGVSFGINMAVAFLIGVGAGALGGADEGVWAGGYACGAAWTVLVTVGFWQVRPYRRLEQEVAGAWQAVADLLAVIGPEQELSTRHRREQVLAARHRAAREAIERAHDTVGEARAGTSGFGLTMAQLVVLIASGSRVGAAAVSLSEIGWERWTDPQAVRAAAAIIEEIERTCRTIARGLLAGRGGFDLGNLRSLVAGLQPTATKDAAMSVPRPAVLAFAQALRNLQNADEALRLLRDQRRHLPTFAGLAIGGGGQGRFVDPIRNHLSFNSAIFRHALRVALLTGLGTAIIVHYNVGAHGIWLPMTALVVLQPDYGGTLTRALQRSAGTVAGSILASILIVTLRGTAAFEAAVAVLLFATFFLIRRRYGHAMAFLTPLIILLVGFSGPNPWEDLIERVVFTLIGAAAALVAGYVLWPQWEHDRLPDRLAAALRAGRRYAAAVFEVLPAAAAPTEKLGPLRRAAEIEVTNLDAAFQRMLTEPARQRGRVGKLFMLTVYIHRLCRHTIALEAQVGAPPLPAELVTPLRRLIEGALDDIADALVQNRAPVPRPDFDEPLARIRETTGGADATTVGVDLLLGQIVSDVTALNAAACAVAEAARDG
ncbi:MAG TPA: FUSC family protein [Alphaproteobacteria bacterium]|nr:FUSC family protein [Alphaproteobacteria bacterium]